MADERFPRKFRIRNRADFERLFRDGQVAADPVLVVRACRNGLPYTRLGLAVSRKAGTAVVRNRWKRLIREAFRKARCRLPVGYDLVVRPRRGSRPDGAAVAAALPALVRRAVRKIERRERKR